MWERMSLGGEHVNVLGSEVRALAGVSDLEPSLPVTTSTSLQHLAKVWVHHGDLEIPVWIVESSGQWSLCLKSLLLEGRGCPPPHVAPALVQSWKFFKCKKLLLLLLLFGYLNSHITKVLRTSR